MDSEVGRQSESRASILADLELSTISFGAMHLWDRGSQEDRTDPDSEFAEASAQNL